MILVTCSERIIVLMVFISSLSSSSSFVRLIIIIIRSNHHIRQVIVASQKKNWKTQYANVNQLSSFCKKHFWCLLKSEALLVQYFSPSPPAIGVSWLRGAKLSPAVKYYNNIWISFASKIVFFVFISKF